MKQHFDQFLRSRFIRFLLAGACAAAINILSRYFLSERISFRSAVLIAYLLGMMSAWMLSRLFVFEASGRNLGDELLRFGIVNIFAAAQVWGISVGLAEWIFPRVRYDFHPYETAHLVGVIFPIFTSFLGHRYFSFAKVRSPNC